jgi:hypothetical protein
MVPGPAGKPVPAVDFLSTGDTPLTWELNVWYHTLNVGFRPRVSGETDFPCIYGERMGMGRSYVGLDGKLTYAKWVAGIEEGRAYVGDGRSHIIDFKAGNVELGRKRSEVALASASDVSLTARIAAYLPETPDTKVIPYAELMPTMGDAKSSATTAPFKPYWHIERARVGSTRNVKVEAIVNGYPVAEKEIPADGKIRPISFSVPIRQSSWVALRILGTAHTNPLFVMVGGKPICASRRSAGWLRKGVDQLWSQKKGSIGANEQEDAVAAYDHARTTYDRLLKECAAD